MSNAVPTIAKGRRLFHMLALLTVTAAIGNASQVYLPAQVFAYGPIGPNGSATATFNKFDPSAYGAAPFRAVLTSVEIILASTSSGVIDILNLNATPQAFTDAFTQIPVTVSSIGITYQTIAMATVCGSFATPTGNPGTCTNSAHGVSGIAEPFGTPGLVQHGAAPNAENEIVGVSGTATHNAFVNPAVYGSYSGSGGTTVTVNIVSGGASSGGTATPGISFGGTSISTGTLSLIYGYDLVHTPEPAAWALMSGALLALGLLRRKRLA